MFVEAFGDWQRSASIDLQSRLPVQWIEERAGLNTQSFECGDERIAFSTDQRKAERDMIGAWLYTHPPNPFDASQIHDVSLEIAPLRRNDLW
jgi:hypothetical protein